MPLSLRQRDALRRLSADFGAAAISDSPWAVKVRRGVKPPELMAAYHAIVELVKIDERELLTTLVTREDAYAMGRAILDMWLNDPGHSLGDAAHRTIALCAPLVPKNP